jgi:calcium-dependent protein kinase
MGCYPCKLKDDTIKLIKSEENRSLKIHRSMLIQGYDSDPFLRYQQIKELGEGSYGKVYKVFDRINKTYKAVKQIKKSTASEKDEEKILKEIEILKMLDHPNIIKLHEFYSTKSQYYIITELISCGELYNKISHNQTLEEPVALHVMKQLLCAVNYCHKKKIIHGDLKPENILLDDNDKFFNIKIIDFGTSEIFKDKGWFEKQIGTPYYVAPEILDNNYNEKCDLWSCGVIFYILLSGTPPFRGKTQKDIFKSVKFGKYSFKSKEWENISLASKDLINKLLEFNIEKRYSAEQALNHYIFKDDLSTMQTTFTESEQLNLAGIMKNLDKYKAYKNLQKATLYFIIHNCTPKNELKAIKNLFVKFDSNFDGRLTKEELGKGIKSCKSLKLSSKDLDTLMYKLDLDKSGYIEYEEFLTATYDTNLLLTDKNLQCAFCLFDKDNSGKISADELKEVFGVSTTYDNKIWDKIISEVDIDGDNEISYEEFKLMMFSINNVNEL